VSEQTPSPSLAGSLVRYIREKLSLLGASSKHKVATTLLELLEQLLKVGIELDTLTVPSSCIRDIASVDAEGGFVISSVRT